VTWPCQWLLQEERDFRFRARMNEACERCGHAFLDQHIAGQTPPDNVAEAHLDHLGAARESHLHADAPRAA
jgi:hypothetical protein